MKARKYTLTFIALIALWYIWKFVEAAVEQGLPTYPLYYIASGVEICLGYLTYRFSRSQLGKRLPFLVFMTLLLCFVIPIALSNVEAGIFWQVGGSQLWYVLSILGLEGFKYIKGLRTKKELTKEEEDTEYLTKGVIVGPIIVALIVFVPLAIVFGIFFLLAVIS